MTRYIINILKQDEELKALLKASILDSKIYPLGTDQIQDCIVYKNVPVTDDGIKAQYRLEITVIALSLGIGEQILERIKEVLITIADTKKHSKILNCSLNGGGLLENLESNTYHYKAYFNYTTKKESDK